MAKGPVQRDLSNWTEFGVKLNPVEFGQTDICLYGKRGDAVTAQARRNDIIIGNDLVSPNGVVGCSRNNCLAAPEPTFDTNLVILQVFWLNDFRCARLAEKICLNLRTKGKLSRVLCARVCPFRVAAVNHRVRHDFVFQDHPRREFGEVRPRYKAA